MKIKVHNIEIIEHPDVTLVLATNPTKIIEICNKMKATKIIHGLYRIVNTNDCMYDVNSIIIQNYSKIENKKFNFITNVNTSTIDIVKNPQLVLKNNSNIVIL